MEDILDILEERGALRGDKVRTDSRLVSPGDVFVALAGTAHDGHDYIAEASARGASHVLCERAPGSLTSECGEKLTVVNDTREVLADIARRVYGDPSAALPVYGVTGTNGKTTTVFLLDNILKKAGRRPGIISTVFNLSRGDTDVPSEMTTPDVMTLNRLMEEMLSDRKNAAVMEISSHALEQGRVLGIGLDSAVFTNITPEHLDYHGDMNAYFMAKSRIFDNLKEGAAGILNIDDPRIRRLAAVRGERRMVTFGEAEGADVRATDVRLSSGGSEFCMTAEGAGAVHIRSPLIGRHNVHNMLAAAASALSCGIGLDAVTAAMEDAPCVPGRLEAVQVPEDRFRVFVDYAHTPDALESVLACLRPLAAGRLICVFGCGGDRDRTKRPVMGGIAVAACDSVILTSDNPRTEDPAAILGEIEKGMPAADNYSIIENRRDAIRAAFESAGEGDIVLIAGKGHEAYQIVGDRKMRFDDREEASAALRKLEHQ